MMARAKNAPKHIVLAEGQDPRIVQGAVQAVQSGIAEITLLGHVDHVRALTREAGDTQDKVKIIDPLDTPPLDFANDLVHRGDADGSVAGAVYTTPEVVRSALKTIGVHEDYDLVSSLFIMLLPDASSTHSRAVVFSDCGMVVDPNAKQLADIASASSDSARHLLGADPKVAMLSFATYQSAAHDFVDKVVMATDILKTRRPDLCADGPLQFDSAFVPKIAAAKAPDSAVKGQANVFIFPDLNAGNIGYKIAERLGGASAIGPVLQGLAKPANDLSRGCDAQAVTNMIAVTVLQAQAYHQAHHKMQS
jgi:phosphate acetyltransferase